MTSGNREGGASLERSMALLLPEDARVLTEMLASHTSEVDGGGGVQPAAASGKQQTQQLSSSLSADIQERDLGRVAGDALSRQGVAQPVVLGEEVPRQRQQRRLLEQPLQVILYLMPKRQPLPYG